MAAPPLSKRLAALLSGNPWGAVFPSRQNPPPLAFDGRSVALSTLRSYLSEIQFRRPGGRDARGKVLAPISFQILEKDIQIGWPDYEKEMNFPSLVFLHGTGAYEPIGLTSYIEEDTRDRYGKGTVVLWSSEYTENFQIEIWANKRTELRAIIAGIETSLTPTEVMYGLRFKMPDYFGQLVRFTPNNRQEFDEQDSAMNRRRARIEIEMCFNIVSLVNYELLRPELQVQTDVDTDYNTPVLDVQIQPDQPTHEGPCEPCG
jgi:hypothetical protein